MGAERNIFGLKCTESGDINYFYSKGKKKGEKKKIEVKKFSPRLKRRTLHKEVKLSK